MHYFRDREGRLVRLTDERQNHFESEHPEMVDQIDRISETLEDPERIVRSRTDSSVKLFYRLYESTPVRTKFLCVVVKVAQDDQFIITALFTDTIKRGEILWQRK